MFDSISLFYAQEQIAQVAFSKEQPWAICSGRSWEKSDREWFAQAAHDKRATGAISSFSWASHSFAQKKWANRSKNLWANSQPCTNKKMKEIFGSDKGT